MEKTGGLDRQAASKNKKQRQMTQASYRLAKR
jgi:hypothetical protein